MVCVCVEERERSEVREEGQGRMHEATLKLVQQTNRLSVEEFG